jgi:hypothetical protein
MQHGWLAARDINHLGSTGWTGHERHRAPSYAEGLRYRRQGSLGGLAIHSPRAHAHDQRAVETAADDGASGTWSNPNCDSHGSSLRLRSRASTLQGTAEGSGLLVLHGALPETHHVALAVVEVRSKAHVHDRLLGRYGRSAECSDFLECLVDVLDIDRDDGSRYG